jgi:hypothetical protein
LDLISPKINEKIFLCLTEKLEGEKIHELDILRILNIITTRVMKKEIRGLFCSISCHEDR